VRQVSAFQHIPPPSKYTTTSGPVPGLTPIPVVDPSLQCVAGTLIQLHVFAAATIGLPAGDGDGVGVGVAVGRGVAVGVGLGVALGRAPAVAVAVGLAVGLGVGLTPGLVLPRGLGVGLGPADGVAVGVATGTLTELAEPPLPLQPAVAAAPTTTNNAAMLAIPPRMHQPLSKKRAISVAPGYRV
jgi:hypothetical protein